MSSHGRRRRWALLGAAAAGTGAGVVIGGSLAPRVYDWETEWTIDAPLADVYAALSGSDNAFWPSMRQAPLMRPERQAQAQEMRRIVQKSRASARLSLNTY